MKKEYTYLFIVIAFVAGIIVGVIAAVLYEEKNPMISSPVQTPSAATAPSVPPAEAQKQIGFLQSLLKEDPKNLKALIELGNLYFDTEQFDRAVEVYSQALNLDPKNADLALLPLGPDAQADSFGELSTCRYFRVPSTTENPRDVVLAFAAALSKYREAFKDESIAYNKGVGRAMTIPGVNREKNIDFYGLYDFNTEMEVVYNREAMFSKISSLRSSLVSKILALTSVSTAIAEVEPEMQNHIDSIMASW